MNAAAVVGRLDRRRGVDETKKSLFEEFLGDVLFFAAFVVWGLASSTTVAWIPACAHVVASLGACVATLVGRRGDTRDERRSVAIAVVAGWACAIVGCVDALAVTQVGCRLWDDSKNPTSFSSGIDVSREVDVVLAVGAHLLGLTMSVYRARRAGHDFDVDASFVSLGAGFGVAFAYVSWLVLDVSFGKCVWHLLVVLVAFVVLGPALDAGVTFAPSSSSERREWCNGAHIFHTIGVVVQYVVLLANVAYLFDVDASFGLLTHPHASACARAQAAGLLLVFLSANAHRNANMLATSGSARKIGTSSRGKTLERLGEIEPWIAVVVWSNRATAAIGPTIVAVTVAFAERTTGLVRFALLAYATFAWARGKAQVASCGWGWEITASLVGGVLVDAALAVVLLAWPGLTRDGDRDLDDIEKQIIAGVVIVDAVVAAVVCASAGWASAQDAMKKNKRC